MEVCVYVLESEKDGLRYVGMTIHLEDRVAEHNAGKSKFTRGHVPWKLIYFETVEGRIEARKREKYIKSAAGRRFVKKQLGEIS